MNAGKHGRLDVLDGWRGISILLVLATHLLPLGPKSWQLNSTAGQMGMAIFFTLSGFLITRYLLSNTSLVDFLVRRTFRVVPLAWVGLAIAFPIVAAPISYYVPNFLFFANLPPKHLVPVAAHYWSICVEMQFYAGMACIVGMFGRRGLVAIPALCVAITAIRIWSGTPIDIVTWRRADEILAGGILALLEAGCFRATASSVLSRMNVYALLGVLAVCSHPRFEWFNYARPYVAAMLVGSTLNARPSGFTRILKSRVLAYVAAISYALYIIHHLLAFTWLGTGETKLAKYAKRPLLFAATFALAHLSTFQFERPLIGMGKRLSNRLRVQLTRA
jgi:peptidoglycan/LPS O-acetylase OafA/YrhL